MRVLLIAIVIGATVLPPGPAAAARRLVAGFTDHQVVTYARQCVIADLDGDLIPDLAVSSSYDVSCYGIALLKGIGDGTFTTVETLPPDYCGEIVGADLDDDGDIDLVTSGAVWLGGGDLSFAPSATFDVGGAAVAVAEVTGDSILDVVVPGPGSTVRILPGLGDGTLDSPIDVPASGSITALATGDFDGNGHRDIVINTFADSIQVFLNAGGAVFGVPAVYPSPHVTAPIMVARIDADSILDLVVGATWLKGHADGTFDAPAGTPFAGVAAQVADLDGNGASDVVSWKAQVGLGTDLAVQLGDGAGGFGAAVLYSAPAGAYRPSVGDLDDDGTSDMVLACASWGQVAIYLGHGDGSFDATLDYATPGDPVDVEVAEVSGDAHPDVLVLCPSSASVCYLPGSADGTLGAAVPFATPADPRRFALGDVDDDGRPDLVTANGSSNTISVFPALPGGGFGVRSDHAMPSGALDVAIADLDGDLIGDVVALAERVAGVATVCVFPGQAGGPLGSRVDHPISVYTSGASRVFAGNVSDDGEPDVVVMAALGEDSVWLLYQGSGGALSAPVVVYVPTILTAWAGFAADVDDDGVLDLLTASLGFLVVELSNGDGTFTDLPYQGLPTYHRRSRAMAVGFLDDDSHLDLVTGCGSTRVAAVHFGDGSGVFDLERGYGTHGHPLDVALGDLDGDGVQDVVVGNEFTSDVTVLLGNPIIPAGVGAAPRAAGTLAFTRLWPVPSRGGALHATFRMPAPGRVTLELADVGGRRVARRDLGVLDAGIRNVSLELPAALGPGVYWLRITDGVRSATARAAVVR